jgi:hypothetical protein
MPIGDDYARLPVWKPGNQGFQDTPTKLSLWDTLNQQLVAS